MNKARRQKFLIITKWLCVISFLGFVRYLNARMFHEESNQKEQKKNCYFLTAQWMHKKNQGFSIESYLKERKISRIAIYGMGILGKLLYEELENSSIIVNCFIDAQGEELRAGYHGTNAYSIQRLTGSSEADAVIVTPFYDFETIKTHLTKENRRITVLSLEEIIMG